MSTGIVGIYPGKNGAPHAAGWDLDVVFNRITAAAGMPDPAATGLTYGPLVQWLCDGYEPSDIAALIERRAATAGYRPPRTLSYFDKPVRQELRRGKVWVDLEGKPITA